MVSGDRDRDLERLSNRIEEVEKIADGAHRRIDSIMLTTLTEIQIKLGKLDGGSSFVTKDEFEPIKRLIWGFVSVILLAVGGAVISLVIKAGGPH